MPRLRWLQPAAVAQWARSSLFVLPGTGVLLGALLAEILVRIDRAGGADWLPTHYETTVDNARAVLAAVATGTITVVTLVLTFTLVAVQLAAGQMSPRTISDYLDDRFQQVTIAFVLGTATYSLVALRAVRAAPDGSEFLSPDLTVLAAVLLTVVSLLLLVRSVDRLASRLQVGQLIDDITDETCALVHHRHGSDPTLVVDSPVRAVGHAGSDGDWASGATISADRAGWIQHVDDESLVEALPENSRTRLRCRVGTFVYEEMILAEIDVDELDDDAAARIRRAIVIGDSRTMQQDIAFGIDRLVDIALRALSPGINDPNTAREAILRLGQIVLALLHHELTPLVEHTGGREIHHIDEPDHDDYVAAAFDQIRRAAADHVEVRATMLRTVEILIAESARLELPGRVSGLEHERDVLTTTFERSGADIVDRQSLP